MKESVEQFCNRPSDQVANELAVNWSYFEDRKKDGASKRTNRLVRRPRTAEEINKIRLIGVTTPLMTRLFRVEYAELYSHEITMKKWPDARGPEILQLPPGSVISYNSRGVILTFVKTLEGTASNIWLASFSELNVSGEVISLEPYNSRQFAAIAGIERHQTFSQLESLNLPRHQGFLLCVGGSLLTPDQMDQLEASLLSGFSQSHLK